VSSPSFREISRTLRPYGLVARGAFNSDDEDLPPSALNTPAKALVLAGTGGSEIWPVFNQSPEYSDGQEHPLDRWSQRVGDKLAKQFSGVAVYPFGGPPYHPFLKWAKRAEPVQSSQLGMLIHPEFGLWNAYRFAVLLSEPLADVPAIVAHSGICRSCTAKPCLGRCPVGAFTTNGYDVEACYQYLHSTPAAECLQVGCVARRSCPESRQHSYVPEHARFHMAAFLRSQERKHAGD